MITNLSEFERYVLLDVEGCSGPLLTFQTLQAIIEFCSKTHVLTRALQYTISSADIDDDINDYIDIDLGEYAYHERLSTLLRLNINGTDWKAFRKNITDDVTNFEDIRADGTKYFDFIGNSTLRVFDVTSSETSWYLEVAFKPLQAATAVDSILFEDWLDPIVAGAKHKLLSMPNKPWTSYESAAHYFTSFHRGMSEASMSTRKGFTDQPLSIQPQIFGNPRW